MTFQAEYPDLTGLTVGQQIDELFNRFISLSRQVEYAISHIDSQNLTPAFHKRLADEAGNVSELTQTAENLSSSIETKADKSELTQTAKELSLSIESKADKSELKQTADEFSLIIENKADKSELTQATEDLSQSIESKADRSELTQTAKDLSSSIESKADKSELTQTAENLSLSIENKADKSAAYYRFDSKNLNIYSGGIKIFNGTLKEPGDVVFYADENGSLRLRGVLLEDLGGNVQASISNNGIYAKSICFDGFMDDKIYARISSYDHFILGGGAYGLSFTGSNPSQDHGLEFNSGYTRTISSATGIPSNTEKKEHSGISLYGDVVISNFGDDYYRYPVVADANYKYRVYLEDAGALVVARYNAKTNKLMKECKFNPSSII